MLRLRSLTLAALTTFLALTGCSDADAPAGSDEAAVVVSFYPLEFIVERLTGDGELVTNLTAPGAEPHDLELTPRAVASEEGDQVSLFLLGQGEAPDEGVDLLIAKGTPAAIGVKLDNRFQCGQ